MVLTIRVYIIVVLLHIPCFLEYQAFAIPSVVLYAHALKQGSAIKGNTHCTIFYIIHKQSTNYISLKK